MTRGFLVELSFDMRVSGEGTLVLNRNNSRNRHGSEYRGTSLIRPPPPVGPYSSPCLGIYGDPRGVSVSYERSTPVAGLSSPH